MKRYMILAVAVGLALSGCASIADKMGLANKTYVDQQDALAEERAAAAAQERLDAMVAQIRGELDTVRQDTQQMKDAVQTVNEMVASMSQIQELAKEFETRLTALPEETLRKLIQILSAYLDTQQQQ